MSGVHIRVNDDEELYRRIPSYQNCIRRLEDGSIRLSASAFNDRFKKPSVDRKNLRSHPSQTQVDPSDGVVTLITSAVRNIAGMVKKNDRGKVIENYIIDVIPDPIRGHSVLPDNPAHALIVSDPDDIRGESFNRLKEALSLLVTREHWLIPSQEDLPI